ncbi:MAG: hypothetical protein P4M14_05600 [Gammaproteobacteria bacterium]|nr:hypothetical protein [Gammaproteobacteria bacterium]
MSSNNFDCAKPVRCHTSQSPARFSATQLKKKQNAAIWLMCAEEVRQISIEKTPAAAKADRIRRIFAGWPQISKMLGVTSATDDDQMCRIADRRPDIARTIGIIRDDEYDMYSVTHPPESIAAAGQR